MVHIIHDNLQIATSKHQDKNSFYEYVKITLYLRMVHYSVSDTGILRKGNPSTPMIRSQT